MYNNDGNLFNYHLSVVAFVTSYGLNNIQAAAHCISGNCCSNIASGQCTVRRIYLNALRLNTFNNNLLVVRVVINPYGRCLCLRNARRAAFFLDNLERIKQCCAACVVNGVCAYKYRVGRNCNVAECRLACLTEFSREESPVIVNSMSRICVNHGLLVARLILLLAG